MRIVVLTGAGISAESGIATFRASDGLWEQHPVEEVATPQAFERNPDKVQAFYNARRRQLKDAAVQPNAAHKALALLESHFGRDFLLVTQNVDDLHERAGSHRLIHMHGELRKVRCVRSGKVYEHHDDVTRETLCTCCHPSQVLRPHIVWFGEMPLQMEEIYDALREADLFVSIGTSGNVYPAAGFVQVAREAGAQTAELNLEPSAGQSLFGRQVYGPATRIVPAFVQDLIAPRA